MVHEVRHQLSDLISRYRAISFLHKDTYVVICACDLLSFGVLPTAINVSDDGVSQSYHCIPPPLVQLELPRQLMPKAVTLTTLNARTRRVIAAERCILTPEGNTNAMKTDQMET